MNHEPENLNLLQLEVSLIIKALNKGGSPKKAAELMGVSAITLYRKMKAHNIKQKALYMQKTVYLVIEPN